MTTDYSARVGRKWRPGQGLMFEVNRRRRGRCAAQGPCWGMVGELQGRNPIALPNRCDRGAPFRINDVPVSTT
jgi:hypothetical protein